MGLDKTEIRRRENIIIGKCGGISPVNEVFYIFSLYYCAERSHFAFSAFDKAKRQQKPNAVMITALVHEALGHAAALSRFFWPARSGRLAAARAEKLRAAFGVTDDSPLKDRSLRNSFEHFDENLDSYLLHYDAGYFFPEPMLDTHELADQPIGRIFKLVDVDSECIVLLNKKFYFSKIRTEVDRLLSLTGPLIKNGRLKQA